MKMKKFLWSVLAIMMVSALSIGFTSCNGDHDEDEVAVSTPMASFDRTGGSQTIQILSNTNWTISGAQSWLMVSPMQGSNNGMITITANENTERSARSCTLFISAGSASTSITVNQQGKNGPSIEDLIGSYTGTLKPMGYSDDPARCYVTITQLSNDAVRISSLICEEFGIDANPVNMLTTINNDGSISLRSETSYAIEGSFYLGQLTLSFTNSVATFYFTGTKNDY